MTEKQKQFLDSLCAKHGMNPYSIDQLDTNTASKLITELLSQTQTQYSGQKITDGMYSFQGRIVKVQIAVHGSGNLYAKELNPITKEFEYVKGLVNKLHPENKMSIEEAKAFGKLYGICCCCGRTLTDEYSIANGIGPICAGKYF